MRKKVSSCLLAFLLVLSALFCSSCTIVDVDPLAEELKSALGVYLSSESFDQAVLGAKTTQSRLPLLYLRYVKGDFYSEQAENDIKGYLSAAEEIMTDGEFDDAKYENSSVKTTGWYGVTDYLYSFSLLYNQYEQILYSRGETQNEYAAYLPAVKKYLSYADGMYSVKIEYENASITLGALSSKITNAVNNFTSDRYRLDGATVESIAATLCAYTQKDTQTAAFVEKYKEYAGKYSEMAQADKNDAKNELKILWAACVPSVRCAFGYNIYSVLFLSAYNLGFDCKTVVPASVENLLSYYEKDENGNFIKDGGTPNWVGFSGRPLAGSALRGEEEYSLAYEKTMQGYFPFTDGWSQPLDEMINMDRLCNFYNNDLGTGASVAPFYGILYGYMNGIDMERYKKEVYHSAVCADPSGENCPYHIDEEDGTVYNVVSLWREKLQKDENGKIVITNVSEMAVAIAYVARYYGVEAPSPLGAYSGSVSVIRIPTAE